jgi:hypothetical protein
MMALLMRIFLMEAPFHAVLADAGLADADSEPQCASSLGSLA